MSVSVGLVGFGNSGRFIHCPLITAAGMTLAGVVTRQAEAVRQSLDKATVYDGLDALLSDPVIELVVIATPNHLHAPQAMAALQAGKHVVIDKPFALNLDEVDALLKTAEQQRRYLSVFHNRRWDSDFLMLKQVLDSQRLGEIYSVQMRWDRYRPTVLDRWRERQAAGGGLFPDLGSHLIDQMLCLFGLPDWVQADLLTQRPGATVEDGFELWFGKGALRVHIGCSSIAADNHNRYRIHGALGSLSKGGLDVQEQQLRSMMNPLSAEFGVEPVEHYAQIIDANDHRERVPAVRGDWLAFYRGMRDAIKTHVSVPVPGGEAREVMRVLEAARTSHVEQRRVHLR
jgi:scyllo-inositol 2-dehydrogenase (NADP+)